MASIMVHRTPGAVH